MFLIISPDAQSPCQKLRDELNGKKLIGAYIPRCTLFGEFEPMQVSVYTTHYAAYYTT